jgi:F0F1-type ATP synthase assembly protein I
LSGKSAACYNFAASQGRFGTASRFTNSTVDESRVHDPIHSGRRVAMRAVALQAAVTLLVAVAFLVAGPRQAFGAAAGGIAMLAGNALAAFVALGGGIQPAGAAFARLLLGTAGKWLVAIVVVAVALGVFRLPPLPLLAGLAGSLLAYLLALNLRMGRQR